MERNEVGNAGRSVMPGSKDAALLEIDSFADALIRVPEMDADRFFVELIEALSPEATDVFYESLRDHRSRWAEQAYPEQWTAVKAAMDRGDALTPDEATVLRSINLAFAETSGWHLGKLIELAQRGED